MIINPRKIAPLMIALFAAATISACASKPKPAPVAPTPPPAPAPEVRPPPPQPPPPPPPPMATGPVAGSEKDFVINAGDRVLFDYDKFNLSNDARPVLDAQAAWLVRYGQVKVRIEGNCDERGTRDYNFALGARRANSVKEYLVSHGVAAERIMTLSNGKEHLTDVSGSEDGQAKNRNGHTVLTDGAR